MATLKISPQMIRHLEATAGNAGGHYAMNIGQGGGTAGALLRRGLIEQYPGGYRVTAAGYAAIGREVPAQESVEEDRVIRHLELAAQQSDGFYAAATLETRSGVGGELLRRGLIEAFDHGYRITASGRALVTPEPVNGPLTVTPFSRMAAQAQESAATALYAMDAIVDSIRNAGAHVSVSGDEVVVRIPKTVEATAPAGGSWSGTVPVPPIGYNIDPLFLAKRIGCTLQEVEGVLERLIAERGSDAVMTPLSGDRLAVRRDVACEVYYEMTASRFVRDVRITPAMARLLRQAKGRFAMAGQVLGDTGTVCALIDRGLCTAGTANELTPLGERLAHILASSPDPDLYEWQLYGDGSKTFAIDLQRKA